MKPNRFSLLFISMVVFSALLLGCTKDEVPSDPIQPSDEGAVDPNAAALPSDLDGPIDPLGEIDPGDFPASDDILASDDAVDAPLGTLTEDPWAAPGAPSDIKGGSGQIAGEDLGSPGSADTSGIPSMGEDSPMLAEGAGLGFEPAKKKVRTPKVSSGPSKKKAAKAKSKIAMTPQAKTGSANAKAVASTEGSGNSRRYVKAIQLNIRSAPDRKASMVRRIKGGDQVNVTVEGAWAKLGDGEYVRTKFLSTQPQRVVSEAEVEAAWKAKRGAKKSSAVNSSKKSKSLKANAKKGKPKSSSTTEASLENSAPADFQGSTSLPPDPNAPAIEGTPEEQFDGDQD